MDEDPLNGSAGSDLSQGAAKVGSARHCTTRKRYVPMDFSGLQPSLGLTTACFELRVAVISLSTSLISKGFIR
jgi:hypothetical protein